VKYFLLNALSFSTIFIVNGQLRFEESAISVGIDHQYQGGTAGGGASFFDINGDGWDDISLAKSDGIAFYLNTGQGRFNKVIPFGLKPISEKVKQILWVDIDNDGDFDLYYTSETFDKLYLNVSDFHFQEVTSKFNLIENQIPSFAAAWGDVNLDGNLDLYVSDKSPESITSNRLYLNTTGQFFNEASDLFNVSDPGKKPFALAFVDINNDLYPDLYMAQDREAGNTLLANRSGQVFEDISVSSNANLIMEGMSVSLVDIDRNGFTDLYITNIESGNKFLLNNGDETFTEKSSFFGVEYFQISWGANFLDFDNDGDNDLYVSSSVPGIASKSAFFINDLNHFTQVNLLGMEKDTVISYGNAIGDFNNDGKLDIVVNNTMPYKSHLWQNLSNTKNGIKISLIGTKSNKQGVGVRLEGWSNGISETKYTTCGNAYLGQNSQWEHFGLGDHNQMDSIRIFWPSGIINIYYDLAANKQYYFIEHEGEETLPVYQSSTFWCETSDNYMVVDYRKSIEWITGETTQRIKLTREGEYSVTGQNNGDAQIQSLMIERADEINFNFQKIDISCFGKSNGTIDITADFGVSILWDDGDTSLNKHDLKMGVYNAYLYREGHCGVDLSFTISEPKRLIAFIERETIGSVERLNALTQGGVEPYQYEWIFNQIQISTNQYYVPEQSGIYQLIVTDDNDCTSSFSIYFEVTPLAINHESILVFPNPAIDWIQVNNIDLSKLISISLIDLSGAIVHNDFIYQTNQITFRISNLPKAVYLIKLQFNDGSHVQKKIIYSQ